MNQKLLIGIIILILTGLGGYIFFSKTNKITSPPPGHSSPATFTGTVRSGKDIGREYCSEGLYLVAEEGSYLFGQSNQLQLRFSDTPWDVKAYINQTVTVKGVYPDPKQAYCDALSCACDDYILVDKIN